MDKKENFMALCLLDALEDQNLEDAKNLILIHKTNPNTLIIDRGIAPIHYACGMENEEFADEIVKLMLDHGGDVNVCSEDNLTPLHVASIWGRANVVNMLLEKGADVNVVDNDNKTPILYAIEEQQFAVMKIYEDNFFKKEANETKGKKILISANVFPSHKSTSFRASLNEFTLSKTNPFWINMTERKFEAAPDQISDEKNTEKVAMTNKQVNLYDLTESNLSEYTRNAALALDRSKISFIKAWREKVQLSKTCRSMINKFHDIDSLLNSIITEGTIDFTNTILTIDDTEDNEKKLNKRFDVTGFGKLLQRLRDEAKAQAVDESFVTANTKSFVENSTNNELNFLRSPQLDNVIFQTAEEYVHTDDDNGLVFYEKRVWPNIQEKQQNKISTGRSTASSASIGKTIPFDYDTDVLRIELTNFGEPPGPITKSTKRLYAKRLVRYKKNPDNLISSKNNEKQTTFSVELERTVRSKEWFERISEYMELEKQISFQFQDQSVVNKNLREGHLKMSFIYLLIDPTISENLPSQSVYLSKHDIWKKFLSSIFYVGKGKSIRPYSHLYDAMKAHINSNRKGNYNSLSLKEEEAKGWKQNENISNHHLEVSMSKRSKLLTSSDSRKLGRILNIWHCEKGVVCLHVFHNILPAEAYTREAAIIDALSLKHLTNMKRGNYYGCAKSWNMRQRKHLGVALLYKAMTIFLAEGESQLLPSDLI